MSDTQWILQLDPPAVASGRTMLDLNSGAIQLGSTDGSPAIDWSDAAITEYSTQQGQYGNSVADFVLPNRTVTINLILGGTNDEAEEETARANLAMKVALIQREGGWLLRQRQGGVAMYADVVDAQLTIPDQWGETGDVEPGVQLVLTCLPDFYGDEITLDTMHATGFCTGVLTESGSQAVIEGDYPARCRIVVTDTSGNSQQGLVWGVRSRYYSTSSNASIIIPGTSLSGGGGTTSIVTETGSQFPTVIRSVLPASTSSTDVFGVPSQISVGTYEVYARVVQSSATNISLAWEKTSLNSWVSVQPSGWCFVDLGLLRVDTPAVGYAQWQANVDVGPLAAQTTIWLDYLALVPLDESAGTLGGTVVVASHHETEISSAGAFWTETSGPDSSVPFFPVSTATGDLPRIPPSGFESRPVQMFVKNLRGEITGGVAIDSGVDSMTVQVFYRPCWLSRP